MVNSSHSLLRVAAAVQTSASCSPSPPQRLVLVFQEQRLQLRKLRSAAKVPQPVSSKTGALLRHHVTLPPAAFVASSPAHWLPRAPCHSACVGSGGGGPPFPLSPRPSLSIEYRFHPRPHHILPPPLPRAAEGSISSWSRSRPGSAMTLAVYGWASEFFMARSFSYRTSTSDP